MPNPKPEPQVISDTKRELAKGGVDVAALEAAAARTGAAGPRSNSVILLKNLPYSASEEELRPLVERFGTLGAPRGSPHRLIASFC